MLLITGASGFIGSNLHGDVRWGSSDCDLRDRKSTIELLERVSPSEIIHCAGKHGSFLEMGAQHAEFLDTNVTMYLNILHGSLAVGVKNLLLISSVSAFSKLSPAPLKIADLEFAPVNIESIGYSGAARFAVTATRAYQADYDANFKVVLLGNTYGPGMKVTPQGTMVGNLFSRILSAKKAKRPLVLPGDGTDKRNLTFSLDLDSGLKRILRDEGVAGPLIFSNPESVTVSHVAKKIAKLVGFDEEIRFSGSESVHKDKSLETSELAELGFDLQFTSLEAGLSQTWQWMMSDQRLTGW